MNRRHIVERELKDSRRIVINGESFKVTQIHKSKKLQKRLVAENSFVARGLYDSDRNKILGKTLVNFYKKNGEYDRDIAKIAEKLGIEYLPEPLSHVKQAALDAEDNIALASMTRRRLTDKVKCYG